MIEYLTHYIESNVVCLIIFGIMLAHDLMKVDRQEKQIKYDHVLIAFMAYFVSDMIWASMIAGVIPKNNVAVAVVNFFNYLIMAAITYTWLIYVMAVEKAPSREKKGTKLAILSPFFAATAALIITYFVSPTTLFNENGDLTFVYTVFQLSVPIIYIVTVLVFAMNLAKKATSRTEKRKHISLGCFPLIVIAGGLAQIVLLPDTPIFCFSCTIFMLIFYIQSMEKQISIDPLTKLNNRGELTRYVTQETNLFKENANAVVVMLDINDFKMINDTFGHSEGDRALIIVAESLKQVINNRFAHAFIGRYGGDEFIVILNNSAEGCIDRIASEIRAKIAERCEAYDAPYTVSVGIGYDTIIGEQDSFEECLARADHKLYLDKEYCKKNGMTTKSRK